MENKKKSNPEVSDKQADDPCWEEYKMVGMKTKNGKKVPNCVPDKKPAAPLPVSPKIHDKNS
jgi:hypothetical protein